MIVLVKTIEQITKEAADFFKKEKGFHRLLNAFVKNYRSLGRVGGTARLNNLTEAEKESLSGLLKKDFSDQKSATISVEAFQKAIKETKFAGVNLKELLIEYSGGNLKTKKEKEAEYLEEKEIFFSGLERQFKGNNSQIFLSHIKNKGEGSKGIHQLYDKDPSKLKKCLRDVLVALDNLPEQYERLPVFASRVFKDPHSLDLQTDTGRFFILALQVLLSNENNSIKSESDTPDTTYKILSSPSAEKITEILSFFNIIRDDLLNFVTITGLLAKNQDNSLIKSWEVAANEGMVFNLPLREIIKVHSIIPADNHDKVFIVENSGVFSGILDCIEKETPPLKIPPLICTHGQFKLAALMVIDKLANEGLTIFYSGDFDPEGLKMAERLLNRYPENVKLWRYDIANYKKCMSGTNLSEKRLKMLEKLNASNLTTIKNEIKHTKKAGYQEELIDLLVKDMK